MLSNITILLTTLWIGAVMPAMACISTGLIVWNKTKSDACTLSACFSMFLLAQFVLTTLHTIGFLLEFILNQLYRMH